MAAQKKDFSNISTGRVYDAIADATAEPSAPVKEYKERKTYTEEAAQERLDNMKTTGCKGVKLPRINMAFSPANYEYIRTMARVSGLSLTEFVNKVIAENLEENQATYSKAIEFKNSL